MKTIFCSSAILENKKSEILINSRIKKNYLKSYWEFPGGKVKNGENFYDAIKRELFEELSIDIINPVHFYFTKYSYSKFNLIMHIFKIEKWYGDIISVDGEQLKWVNRMMLKKSKLLHGNTEIVQLLNKKD